MDTDCDFIQVSTEKKKSYI